MVQMKMHRPKHPGRVFTASEIAEFEYCQLVWWHEQFSQLAHLDKEELFARLVELEQEHGFQAPVLPEYQVIEQLLLRQNAFEEGRSLHQEHAEEVDDMQEERVVSPSLGRAARVMALMAAAITVIAIVLIAVALVIR